MEDKLCCYKHKDRVMWNVCKNCKKFLCKECATKYPSGYCEECEQKRRKKDLKGLEKEKGIFSNVKLKENYDNQEQIQKLLNKKRKIFEDIHTIINFFIVGFLIGAVVWIAYTKEYVFNVILVGIVSGCFLSSWVIGFKTIFYRNLSLEDYNKFILGKTILSKDIFSNKKVKITDFILGILIGPFIGIFLIPARFIQLLMVRK